MPGIFVRRRLPGLCSKRADWNTHSPRQIYNSGVKAKKKKKPDAATVKPEFHCQPPSGFWPFLRRLSKFHIRPLAGETWNSSVLDRMFLAKSAPEKHFGHIPSPTVLLVSSVVVGILLQIKAGRKGQNGTESRGCFSLTRPVSNLIFRGDGRGHRLFPEICRLSAELPS